VTLGFGKFFFFLAMLMVCLMGKIKPHIGLCRMGPFLAALPLWDPTLPKYLGPAKLISSFGRFPE
jgi:hypothetical protein